MAGAAFRTKKPAERRAASSTTGRPTSSWHSTVSSGPNSTPSSGNPEFAPGAQHDLVFAVPVDHDQCGARRVAVTSVTRLLDKGQMPDGRLHGHAVRLAAWCNASTMLRESQSPFRSIKGSAVVHVFLSRAAAALRITCARGTKLSVPLSSMANKVRYERDGMVEVLFEHDGGHRPDVPPNVSMSPIVPLKGVLDPSFPSRVAVLMRSRPITDAASAAVRQDWPEYTYDVATLALAAIEMVIAQQGFETEVTYEEVRDGLTIIASRAAANRPFDEHARVAAYVLDALLNRGGREAPFTYRISDFTEPGTHQQRQVQFRLLVEREDPVRGEVVLNATGDAINALVGGLEFDVEDEQAANEFLLERQLARGAFDAAEAAARKARVLSVRLASDLAELVKATRRDLRSVIDHWASSAPASLDESLDHIRGRIDVEHRLLGKVRETLTSDEPDVATASARIAALLDETQKRHEHLLRQVISARGVFLEEQDRQAFRPPMSLHLPDLTIEVFHPLLTVPTSVAEVITARWLSDVSGPSPLRLPRLHRLVNDLWNLRDANPDRQADLDLDEAGEPDPPVLRPAAIAAASRAVERVGLPARLSTLISTCLDDESAGEHCYQAAEIVTLAVLWCFAPEDPDFAGGTDFASRLLGPRAVADTDGSTLAIPGWDGDDLIVAQTSDDLAAANPLPTTRTATPRQKDF